MLQWHDLLGAVLIEFFENSPYVVQTEVDLSLRKQYLDFVVIRKSEGELDRPLPDGMSHLSAHNLISFKSHQDTLSFWSILELVAYYVNYRKQVSQSRNDLLPEDQFRLVAITARFPEQLAEQIAMENREPGVYDVHIGPLKIRVLVIRSLPGKPANAMLKLFSAVPAQIEYACRHYRILSQQTTGIVQGLINTYSKEDPSMASTMEEITRKIRNDALDTATLDDFLKRFPIDHLLKNVPLDQWLKGVPPEDRLKGMPPEDRLKGLSPQEIDDLLRAIKKRNTTGT